MIFSEKEEKAIRKFQNKHYKKCKASKFSIKLSRESGIGTGVQIKCPECKTKEEITDYDKW